MAVSMIDLTTLEGADTPGKVRAMCAQARSPTLPTRRARRSPRSASTPTWWRWRPSGGGSGVLAAVATAFPSGRASLAVKLADTAFAVDAGADEIDMVIDRGAFLAGRSGGVRGDRRGEGGLRRAPT